jgi:hypothetical protein
MALGAFQASVNILIHYERFYNSFFMHRIIAERQNTA